MHQSDMIPLSLKVAALVGGQVVFEEKAETYQVVARLPIYQVAKVDALARRCGKSRTQMLSLVLSVGLEEVLGQLDESVSEQVVELEAECLAGLSGEGA